MASLLVHRKVFPEVEWHNAGMWNRRCGTLDPWQCNLNLHPQHVHRMLYTPLKHKNTPIRLRLQTSKIQLQRRQTPYNRRAHQWMVARKINNECFSIFFSSLKYYDPTKKIPFSPYAFLSKYGCGAFHLKFCQSYELVKYYFLTIILNYKHYLSHLLSTA